MPGAFIDGAPTGEPLGQPRVVSFVAPFAPTIVPPVPDAALIFAARARLYQFTAGGAGVIPYFIKQPAESYPIAFNYAGQLPDGVTVAAGAISALNLTTGLDATGVVLASPTAVLDDALVVVRVLAGAAGVDYQLTFLVTLSDNSILEDDMVMRVVSF